MLGRVLKLRTLACYFFISLFSSSARTLSEFDRKLEVKYTKKLSPCYSALRVPASCLIGTNYVQL